jgi:hypothetical protein
MPSPITPTLRSARPDGSGTAATGVAKKPWPPVLSKKDPTICPAPLMPVAPVLLAPGTSMVVKV